MFGMLHPERVAAVCDLATGLFLGLAAVPPSAQAVETITCTGSINTTFSPPITQELTTVSFSSDAIYVPCISTVPGITDGTHTAAGQVTRSCLTLPDGYPQVLTIDWNNGQSSTAQLSVITGIVGAVYTVTQAGTITDGAFEGRGIVHQLTAPSLDITLCTLGLGDLPGVNYTIVLEIL
ncbi:hypothetical protein [Mesorhizobium xinjiangense]|uniref:hypothetical protein n=1 Tax=Mesorhizobium xinjiangense TaxID=2678685 RepID=UPI0012EE2E0B|nr:hypothetical protein [Mesorhizobium xinjiangense]